MRWTFTFVALAIGLALFLLPMAWRGDLSEDHWSNRR